MLYLLEAFLIPQNSGYLFLYMITLEMNRKLVRIHRQLPILYLSYLSITYNSFLCTKCSQACNHFFECRSFAGLLMPTDLIKILYNTFNHFLKKAKGGDRMRYIHMYLYIPALDSLSTGDISQGQLGDVHLSRGLILSLYLHGIRDTVLV